jgi:hypothetical protein
MTNRQLSIGDCRLQIADWLIGDWQLADWGLSIGNSLAIIG